jgi:hypothetical protein
MLDTFIKNKGITKTIIHKNNKNYYNEVNWDADYDGEKATLSLDIDDNGRKEHVEMKMNDDELAELLNIPSENSSLDKRLYNDFLSKRPKIENKMIAIEMPKDSLTLEKNKKKVHFELENELGNVGENMYTHISSPTSQEEILFPLIVNEAKTRKHRRHRNPKSHVTYKIYRNPRHSLGTSSSSSSSSRKTLKRHKRRGHYSRRTF